MTKEEKIIAQAFTGICFVDGSEMGDFYAYAEKKLGHGVFDLMLANRKFWNDLKEACRQDFTDMLTKQEPSLPEGQDEAAENAWAWYEYRESPKGLYSTCFVDGFKAGVEWMAGRWNK